MTDPIADAIRAQRYARALQETTAYVARRWKELPPGMQLTMGGAWLAFQKMSEQERMLFFALLYQKGTVLAIDRATQIADAQASCAIMAVEKPAA